MQSNVELEDNNGCFVCGKANPIGLKLDFAIENDEYISYFTPAKEYQGYTGITHGGIVCTVLDEIMAGYLYVLGYEAVTGEITVRLRKPMQIGKRVKLVGRIDSENGRAISTSGEAIDDDGNIIATATAKMIKVNLK